MVLALFAILLFMTMVVGFTYDARSQSSYNAGFKLNSYYQQSARSILNIYGSQELENEWVEPPKTGGSDYGDYRFGPLLKSAGDIGKYGINIQNAGTFSQNLGNLKLGYNIWIANNQDDPAISFSGIKIGKEGDDVIVDPNWDTDSKIVVTVEVYDIDDPGTIKATVSSMFGPSGSSSTIAAGDGTTIGVGDDNTGGNTTNTGTDRYLGISSLDDFKPVEP